MSQPARLEFLTGLFVLAGMIAVVWLSLNTGRGNALSGPTYLIEARFANSGGINTGSSVQLAGVPVGRVESLRVDPKDYSSVATLRIRADLQLPTDSMASVKTSGLIGDKYLLLSPGAEEQFLKPGETITMTESSVDLESLIGKMAFGSVQQDKAPSANQSSTAP
jgi:phospholipid/cholesterol/gamma-HCH transport system substrate-binding protein